MQWQVLSRIACQLMAGSVLVYDVWCLNRFSALPSWPIFPGSRPSKSQAWIHLQEKLKHGLNTDSSNQTERIERHLQANYTPERKARKKSDCGWIMMNPGIGQLCWLWALRRIPCMGAWIPRRVQTKMNLARQQSPCEWLRMTSKNPQLLQGLGKRQTWSRQKPIIYLLYGVLYG